MRAHDHGQRGRLHDAIPLRGRNLAAGGAGRALWWRPPSVQVGECALCCRACRRLIHNLLAGRLLPRASKLTKQDRLLCGCSRDFYDGMRGSCASHLVMQLLCEASWCGAIVWIQFSLMGALPPAGLAGLE